MAGNNFWKNKTILLHWKHACYLFNKNEEKDTTEQWNLFEDKNPIMILNLKEKNIFLSFKNQSNYTKIRRSKVFQLYRPVS